MDYLRPVMTIINTFFATLYNHLLIFLVTLTQSYKDHIVKKCPLFMISAHATYVISSPQAVFIQNDKIEIPISETKAES